MSNSNKPNTVFWVIVVVVLIWNLMGVSAYLMQAYMTDEARELLTPEQLELMDNSPSWVTAAFAIGVFAGLLGCITLLMRKNWAKSFFMISILGVLAQNTYGFFMSDAAEVYGMVQGVVMPIFVIIICFFLFYYAKGASAKGWLN